MFTLKMRITFYLVSILGMSSALIPIQSAKRVAQATAGAALAGTLALSPVSAKQDITQGQQLFQQDCASCHSAIKSLPGDQTSLSRKALSKYRDLDENKVKDFVQNQLPHSFMPFAVKYNDQDYKDVAGYVLEKALNNESP